MIVIDETKALDDFWSRIIWDSGDVSCGDHVEEQLYAQMMGWA